MTFRLVFKGKDYRIIKIKCKSQKLVLKILKFDTIFICRRPSEQNLSIVSINRCYYQSIDTVPLTVSYNDLRQSYQGIFFSGLYILYIVKIQQGKFVYCWNTYNMLFTNNYIIKHFKDYTILQMFKKNALFIAFS